MSGILRSVVRALTIAILLPLNLAGQQATDPPGIFTLVGQLKDQDGKRVRVVTRARQEHSGRLSFLGADSIRISGRADSTTLAIAEIDSLWSGRRATGRGAKIGAITLGIAGGVTLGLAIGGVVGAVCETDDCHGVRAGLLGGAITGAGSAIVGAGLGALIGTAVTQWRPLYPEPPAENR